MKSFFIWLGLGKNREQYRACSRSHVCFPLGSLGSGLPEPVEILGLCRGGGGVGGVGVSIGNLGASAFFVSWVATSQLFCL